VSVVDDDTCVSAGLLPSSKTARMSLLHGTANGASAVHAWTRDAWSRGRWSVVEKEGGRRRGQLLAMAGFSPTEERRFLGSSGDLPTRFSPQFHPQPQHCTDSTESRGPPQRWPTRWVNRHRCLSGVRATWTMMDWIAPKTHGVQTILRAKVREVVLGRERGAPTYLFRASIELHSRM
jgi:hypothetical protein